MAHLNQNCICCLQPMYIDHTTHTIVSAMSSGTKTSFTPPSKVLSTHTPSYTLLTSVETNIRESSTSLYQLKSTTVALPQTHHTQLRTTVASTSVAASSNHYNQSELVTTLTQTESVELFHSSPASTQASRSSPLLILTATLTQTESVRTLYSSPASTIDNVGRSSPLLILTATLTQTESVNKPLYSSPASTIDNVGRSSSLLILTATLTHTASTRLLFTSPSSSNAAGWKKEPLSQSIVIVISVTVLAFAGTIVLVTSIIITW